jgi:hypothetical protein
MDATPGTDSLALAAPLPAALPPQRSERREFLVSWWSRCALVALVFALGLFQGSRAALGDISLGDAGGPVSAAPPEAPGAGAGDPDALRGRFFRPPGSDAVRPTLRLRQSLWTPAEATRLALACPDATC